ILHRYLSSCCPPHAAPTTRLSQPTSVPVGITWSRFGIASLPRNLPDRGGVRRFSWAVLSLRQRLSSRLIGSRPPRGGADVGSDSGPGPDEPGTPPLSGLGGGSESDRAR